MEIDYDNITASFKINLIGEATQQTYMGDFKVKCLLSPYEFIEADKLYRNLVGPNLTESHEHALQVSFALSQLKYRIIESPPFWKDTNLDGSHILDVNVISHVFNKTVEAEEKYKEHKKKEAEERQKRITEMLKNKTIEKKPEIETPETPEIGEHNG